MAAIAKKRIARRGMVIRRGSIWWVDLGMPGGSEHAYRRPALVLQSDAFNKSKIRTIIAAVITSNLRLAQAPGNVLLKKEDSGLPKDSVINVSQIVTLDKDDLTDAIGTIGNRLIKKVEKGLKLVLAL
jgi:mRNA interferase MazF